MSLNTSSSSSSSLHPNLSSAVADSCLNSCFFTTPSSFIFLALCITNNLFLLPLCIIILYLGVKQWRQRSTSTSAMMSHSDSFTFHMATMELTGVISLFFTCYGIDQNNCNVFDVSYTFASMTWYGEMFFHVLTCVERYLAVVHPITYLSLRSERGIRIRNVCNGSAWLFSTALTGLQSAENISPLVNSCFLVLSLVIVSFCSLSVLIVLIRPGPGDQGGKRERVDQSKKKAFYTIAVILSMLVLRFSWNLAWYGGRRSGGTSCVVIMSGTWSNLPGSLVLPLLFLLRAGTFQCFKTTPKVESNQMIKLDHLS